MSKFTKTMLTGLIVFFALAVLCTVERDGKSISALGASLSLATVALLLGAWFLKAFVFSSLPSDGPDRETALTDIYAFAYVFTLLPLALLAFPFGNLLNDSSFPDTGPIRLVRGCLVEETTKIEPPQTPAAPAAGTAASPAQTTKQNQQAAGSTTTEPKVETKTDDKGKDASNASVKQPAQRYGSDSGSTAQSGKTQRDWPKGMPVCSDSDVHTVLVTVGGVISKNAPPPQTGASATHPAEYRVSDGFVVPLLLPVLAIVGGVINLMRRVPEFQKRTHLNFAGTTKEAPLQPYEAREFVLFQILQLISAPFLAMVAFYVIAPQSLPSTIALAFVSGFFSEGVLLRIRAVVEGPEKTPTEATSLPSGELEIEVKTAAGTVVQGAEVVISHQSDGRTIRRATSDANGVVSLKSVPAVALKVSAQQPPAAGSPPPAAVTHNVNLAAGQKQKVNIQV